ncbi:hypothetical protein IAU60_004355 [Kwoniella sp. DSM 27419]
MPVAVQSKSVETSPKRTVHRALTARIPTEGQSAWELAHTRPHPTLADNQVLVETTYVALNPFDWQGVAFKYGISQEAKVMGRDGAGVIVDVGKGVERFKLGDRVWFCANSSADGTGAFQEYSVHSASEIGHTPEHITDCKAATLGTGLITAGVALFRTLGLELEDLSAAQPMQRKADAPWILIWGGAGITGVYLIELARLLGYRIICSASPANHEYVRALGADVVLDRWSEPVELVNRIREATNDDVLVAIDNVGGSTTALCREVLQGSSSWRKEHDIASTDDNTPAKLVPLAGAPKIFEEQDDAIRTVDSLRISFSTTFYGHPEFSEALLDRYDELLQHELITPARVRVVSDGLSGIEKGLEDLRHGRVPGGYKLVARLADTPEPAVSGLKRSRDEQESTERVERTKRARDELESRFEEAKSRMARADTQAGGSENPARRVRSVKSTVAA